MATDLPKDALKPPHPDRETGYERIRTDPPPPWFVEIYPGGDGKGFLQKLDRHAILFHDRSPETLIISFDNIGNANDLSFAREPWAWKFCRDMGWSHMGVFSRKKAWYRDAEIIEELEARAASGFFKRFGTVVLTGTSMGGFAALAFSTLIDNARVIAFNPQSTLDERLVPWETRYRFGRVQNWDLPYGDGALAAQQADRVYLFYDHFFDLDRHHAQRLIGPKTTVLKTWYSNHFSAVMLRKLGLLKPVMEAAVNGTLEAPEFYRMFRARRSLPWYMRGLTEHNEAKHPDLLAQANQRFRKLRRREARKAQAAAESTSSS